MATRYTDVNSLKTYALDNTLATNPLKDPILEQAIYRAEMEFDLGTGTRFDTGAVADEVPVNAFVDMNGWLRISVRQRGPVTALTSVKLRNIVAGTPWQTLTWSVDDLILPYADPNGPRPDSWTIRVKPAQVLTPAPPSDMLVKVSYTGGYASIPDALKGLINRLAWWIYKLSEAPLGIVRNADFNLMEIPLAIPPDIRADMNLWRPVA